MSIRAKLWTLLVVVGVVAWSGLIRSTAAEEEASVETLPWLLSGGVLYTEDYTEGIGDVVLPLRFSGEGLWFINPRFSFTDRSAEEYNLGLGYRHLIQDDRALLGGNIFYDRRETAAGASFNQVGLGAEYLSHWWDARANIYLPIDREELVNEFSITETSVTQRTQAGAVTSEWLDPYGQGHSVLQDLLFTQQLQTRTTTRETTRHFKEYELALRGWDAEVGARLPLEMIDEYVRLKAFGGYYHYYGRRGLDDVNGFRGRLEVQVRPAFTLEAVYYEDDALTGGDYALGAYVSLPFDLAKLGNGGNPFAGATERWESGRQPDNMRYRLIDMVKRDPQIRTLLAEPEEQEEERTEAVRSVTRTSTRRAIETAEVATDITFVDKNSGGDRECR